MNQPAKSGFAGAACSVLPVAGPAVAGFAPAALTLAIGAAFLGSPPALAQPSGAQAIHGQASLSRQGNNLLVTTQNGAATSHSAINWQSFSVPGGSTTHFAQPNAASLSINRVVGNNPSAIFGTLSSNGRLVLVNPSGIAVGAGAVVDTAGFTASTLRMSDANALAGRLVFGGDGLASGPLNVDGKILARSGDVVLIGTNVQVGSGALVQSPNGATLLAAGQKVELTGRGLEGIRLELQAPGDQALNLGTLQGDAVGIFAGQLKHTGLIQATGVSVEGGKVVLKGMDAVDISGRVTASKGDQGGQVHATASKVMLRSGAVIDVSGQQGGGEALIGGGWQGKDGRIGNAQQTTVEAGASVKADAIAGGNGGTIVAWSDEATRVHGSLSARGGAASGNGGNIETSGHYLDMQGQVDTQAPNGTRGNLLLDPTDIYIANDLLSAMAAGMVGADVITTGPTFTPTGIVLDSLVTVANLESYLAGANVLVQTTNGSGTGTGFIKLVDGVTWTGGSALGLLADRDIFINAPISGGAGSTLALSAGAGGAGGSITQAGSGAGIAVSNLYAYTKNVNGGSISLTGTGNSISTIGAFAGTGGINLATSGNLTVGNVYSGFGAMGSIAGVSANSSQAVNLTANGGSLTVSDSSNGVKSIGGNISLSGSTVKVFGSPVNANGGNVAINASGSGTSHSVEIVNNGGTQSQVSTTGSGTINITGNLTVGGVSGSAGLLIANSTVSAGSGLITLRGTNVGAADGSAGTKIGNGSAVTSTGGSIDIGGTLNNPSALSGTGLLVEGQIQSGPAGQITLNGSATVGGAAGTGVDVASTASVTAGLSGLTVTGSVSSSTTATNIVATSFSGNASSSGNIAVTGTASAPSASGVTGVAMNGGALTASGLATITITGSGVPAPAPASSYDVNLNGTTVGSGGGEIKLVADRMNISSPVSSGTGRTVIVPFTASRPITLAGPSETAALKLQPAELNLITASTIVIGGSSYNGGITIGNTGGTVSQPGKAFSLINDSSGVISQTAAFTMGSLNADAGTVTLTNTGNQVDEISGRSTTGAFQFVNNKATLTIGTVDGVSGIASSGNTVLVQNTGDIALTQAVSGTGSGNTVVLVGQNFSNMVGASAINPGAGRWLVYSTTPSSNTFGGLASGNNAVWNSSYSLNPPATIAAGNRYVFSAQPTVNVTATAQTKVYDATAAFATPSYTTTGLVDASTYGGVFLQDTLTGALAISSPAKDVGSYSIVQGTLGAPSGYLFGTYTGASATVTPASLTVGGVTANNKVYDATIGASLAGTAGVTALGSDVVTVSGTGAGLFADKNVGTGKAVTVTGYTLSGADAGNYVLVQPSGLSADITPASLAVSGITSNNKVYDATTSATLAGTAGVAALGSDVVSVSGTGTGFFADKNVATGKAVSVSGYTLSGADAGNYVLVQPSGLSADITPASLAVGGVTANNKVYDTTTTATLAGTAGVTALGSDAVTVSGTGTGLFADKNVGAGKTVTVSGYTLLGVDAGNYVVVQPSGLSADITPASLAVGGVTANSKVYDATKSATLAGTASVTALGSDAVSVSGTGTGLFADKNVGTGKSVSVGGYTLSGADAGNYVVVQPSGLSADITPASLTVSGVTANSKVYDATTAASLNTTGATLGGVLGSDSVSLNTGSTTASFADKNVGTSKSVNVSGVALSGADSGNYTVSNPSGVTGDITAAALTVSGVAANSKVYDASTTASFDANGATLAGVIGGDTVSFSGITGRFADKNVGTAKTVMVASVSLAGTDAGNYTLAKPSGLSAAITPASLTVSATNQTKTEGNALVFAGTEFTSSGLVGGETIASFTLDSAGAPAPAPAGSYSITPSAAVAGSGFVATNYAISYAPATLLVAAAPTAPPAPAPAPGTAAVVDQIVALGASPGLAAASIAETSASPLATLATLLKEEEQKRATNQREGTDIVVDGNQCRR